MTSLPLRFAVVCFAAGSLGACASSLPPMPPLGMAEAEPAPPVRAHRFFVNPFFHRASFEKTAPTRLSSRSPIAEICADPEGRAVLDRDLPGLTDRPEYAFFKHMSLQTLKGMSRGKMSDEDVAKVDADLARIGPRQTASLP